MKMIKRKKKPKLGTGERFDMLVRDIMKKNPGYTEEQAKRVAASIGRKKYGNKGFQALAKAGMKRKRKMKGKK